eukprot:GHVU01030315.1.p1 GENE.GHVU01030315.1~~GHVU01030315.1.p1  ORF type:complete len:670 (+),score=96.12 GHVU01030315.1:940-2949(+)
MQWTSIVTFSLVCGAMAVQQFEFFPTWSRKCDLSLKIWCTTWLARLVVSSFFEIVSTGIGYFFILASNIFAFVIWCFGAYLIFGQEEPCCSKLTWTWASGLWFAHLAALLLPLIVALTVIICVSSGICCCPTLLDSMLPQLLHPLLEALPVACMEIYSTPVDLQSRLYRAQWRHVAATPQVGAGRERDVAAQASAGDSPALPIADIVTAFSNLTGIPQTKERATVVSECPICYAAFEEDEKVVVLPCDENHIFHDVCISAWLARSQSCPLCRVNVVALLEDLEGGRRRAGGGDGGAVANVFYFRGTHYRALASAEPTTAGRRQGTLPLPGRGAEMEERRPSRRGHHHEHRHRDADQSRHHHHHHHHHQQQHQYQHQRGASRSVVGGSRETTPATTPTSATRQHRSHHDLQQGEGTVRGHSVRLRGDGAASGRGALSPQGSADLMMPDAFGSSASQTGAYSGGGRRLVQDPPHPHAGRRHMQRRLYSLPRTSAVPSRGPVVAADQQRVRRSSDDAADRPTTHFHFHNDEEEDEALRLKQRSYPIPPYRHPQHSQSHRQLLQQQSSHPRGGGGGAGEPLLRGASLVRPRHDHGPPSVLPRPPTGAARPPPSQPVAAHRGAASVSRHYLGSGGGLGGDPDGSDGWGLEMGAAHRGGGGGGGARGGPSSAYYH